MSENIDAVITEIGDFGRYQIVVTTLLMIPAVFPLAFIGYSHIFVSAVPDHWCAIPELIEIGIPLDLRKNLSIPRELRDGVSKYSHCLMYDRNYSAFFKNDIWPDSEESLPMVKCKNGWEYTRDEYESTLVTEFNLVCDDDWWPSLAVSLFYTGSIIGTILFGWITDKYGRKPAFFCNVFFAVVLPICTAFSPNYQVYVFLRFLVGFVFPALFQTPFILVMELTSTKYRTGIGMVMGMIWGFAMVALCGIAALVREWFTLLIVTSVPFVSIAVYWWIVPESPRWLISQNRMDEAEDLLQKIARINKKKVARNILHKHLIMAEEEKKVESIHPARLLATPNMRKKTILITFIWLTNSLVYTGLSYMSANLGVSDYLAFTISGLVEAPSCLIAWYAMEKWGRRWTTLITMIIVGASCVGNVFVPDDNTILNVLLPSIGKFGITGSFSIVYVYGGELLPTVVRGNGLAFCSVICGLGLIASPYVIYLVVYSRVLPLLIMGLMSIAGGVAAVFLPETLGLSLPESMEEGEEFGKNTTLWSWLPKRDNVANELKFSPDCVPTANGVDKDSDVIKCKPEEELML